MPDFLQRILQRKLIQWCLAYLAGAWALLQGIDFVADEFGWPANVSRVALVVLGVGLLVVAVLAWYHGERGRQKATVPEVIVIATIFVVGAFAVAFIRTGSGVPPAAAKAAVPEVETGSVAVLPFANVSNDPANEYFSDGVSEEILNALGKLPGLRVASRTSSFSFKDEAVAIDEVARRLRVAHVLEGSVRRMRDSVRITAKLIDTRTDRQVWSEDFDRNLTDIFAVQAEIARAVAAALELRLVSAVTPRKPTENQRAYDYYLRGLSEWHSRTVDGFEKAVQHFDAAIREDSAFAEAWAGLALAHMARPAYDVRAQPIESGRRAIHAARRALALNPALVQARTAYGWLLAREELKWQAGSDELERAVRLNPSDATARAYLGLLLCALGRFEESLRQLDQAILLDPRSVFGHQLRGLVLSFAERNEESFASYRAAASIEPDNLNVRRNLARLHLGAGQYDSANVSLRRVAELTHYPHPDETDAFITALQQRNRQQANRMMTNWERTTPFPDYTLAELYALMREREGALRMLKRAETKGEATLLLMRSNPTFAWLRDDPEFRGLIRRLKFPD
jgi:TolB-like protein/protein involved in temperature-dependent protein secretion